MGSSKKHKDRESKKKRKHRSRSRSRERKRRHRDRERSRSPDYTNKEVDSNPNIYNEETQVFDYHHMDIKEKERTEESRVSQTSGGGATLSIQETNRLRAKLGLKPLDLPNSTEVDSKPKKTDSVHVPAINMGQQKKTQRIKEKMDTMKKKRELESKLGKVKGLGESDSDEDGASVWVKKSRKLQKEREMAEKRAKMLEEMDEDFGIGGLVEQEFKKDSTKAYTSRNLGGLRVEHALDKFNEGRNVILTLKDRGVLDEDEEGDVLVNVNIEDDERAVKNLENKKKKSDYKPYDEPDLDEFGMTKPANMLEKYDEEIDGVKKESFTLGSGGRYDSAHEKRMVEIRQQLRAQTQSLSMAAPTLASEYLTHEEAEAVTFNKTRKKVRKIRKKEILKAGDLQPLPDEDQNYGSRVRGRGKVEVTEEGEVADGIEENMEVDASTTVVKGDAKPSLSGIKLDSEDMELLGPVEDLTGVAVEEEAMQNELHSMLAKTRKLKMKKKDKKNPSELLHQLDAASSSGQQDTASSNIILNSTSEFCRNLGEIPTYGLAGNREEDRDELLDMELEMMEQRRREAEQEETTGGWNEVDIDENPVDIQVDDSAVLEEEPIVTDGIGAALKLAMNKGYLELENTKKMPTLSSNYLELQAQNYTIQDKRYDDLDEKNRKRDRYSGGMVTDFREKELYKPNVKLDYVDEGGRFLCAKEAFRQLSHRFHGKGSGKKKTEKRSKKVEEELLMKQMSSTDTPLNTLSLLQDKQRSEKSPFIVLSGSKGFTSNSIVKPS